MIIPFSFTFKCPALLKYVSALSLSKKSKCLILQFLVKCCKLYSVFKILSKSHMLEIFLISSAYYKCSYKLWFNSLKEFKFELKFKFELNLASLWSHLRLGNLNETQNTLSLGFFLKLLMSIFQSINMGVDHKLLLQLHLIGFCLFYSKIGKR